MATTIGNSSPAKLFGAIDPVGALKLQRLLFLLALGAAIVILHKVVHYPLKMPGHHGLETMMLLVLGRLCCTHRWAATVVAVGASGTVVAVGAGHGLLDPVLYLVPALALDLGVLLLPAWRHSGVVLPLLAALAHATKPLIRWVGAEALDLKFGSLVNGLAYPVGTHLMFGAAGATVAVLLWRTTVDRQGKRKTD